MASAASTMPGSVATFCSCTSASSPWIASSNSSSANPPPGHPHVLAPVGDLPRQRIEAAQLHRPSSHVQDGPRVPAPVLLLTWPAPATWSEGSSSPIPTPSALGLTRATKKGFSFWDARVFGPADT